MFKINRSFLLKVHLILASFMFPIMLMFLTTGTLFTAGISGSYQTHVYTLKLTQPLTKDEANLTQFVIAELEKLNLSAPTGSINNKSTDENIDFLWKGSALRVMLKAQQATEATLTVQKESFYSRLIELHKSNGAKIFKLYAILLGLTLLTLLITGFIMALQIPKYRKTTLYSALIGILVFITMVIIS